MPHHFGIETHTRGRGRGGGGGCRYYYSSAGHTNRKKTKAREGAIQFHPPPFPHHSLEATSHNVCVPFIVLAEKRKPV